MTEISIEKNTTALVIIDLLNGIVKLPNLAPRSSQEVIANAAKLATAFREHSMPVSLYALGLRQRSHSTPLLTKADLDPRNLCSRIDRTLYLSSDMSLRI